MDNGEITVNLTHGGGLTVKDAGKGLELQDFYVIDINGKRQKAKARLQDGTVVVDSPFDEGKAKRLCWLSENTYHGGLITNSTGIPMSPFDLAIE
jgi:sialate O-acetylesterase